MDLTDHSAELADAVQLSTKVDYIFGEYQCASEDLRAADNSGFVEIHHSTQNLQ